MSVTSEDIKRIIHLGMESPPLLAEPLGVEDPPELISESLEDKLEFLLNKLSPKDRESLFSKYGYVLRKRVSRQIEDNVLSNISKIKNATSGKL